MIPSFLLKEALVDHHTYYVGWDDPTLVRKPVEKGCGQCGIGKNRVPVPKPQIAGDDHRDLFIQIADQLKKELPSSLVYRNEAEFIQDQEIQLHEACHKARKG